MQPCLTPRNPHPSLWFLESINNRLGVVNTESRPILPTLSCADSHGRIGASLATAFGAVLRQPTCSASNANVRWRAKAADSA